MSERLAVYEWAFGTKKEAAYGTPVDDADLTKSHALLGPADIAETPTVLTDEAEAGRGTEWAGLASIERWDATLHREAYGTPELLGFLAAFWFGNVATTQPDAINAPDVYEHAFTVLRPPTTALPVTSIVEKSASNLLRKMESVVVSTLELSGEVPGRLKVAADLVGSGKVTLPGSFSFPAMPAESQVFFRTNTLVFTLNNVDVSARLLAFALKLDNALLGDAGYQPGSGLYRSTIEYGAKRPITFTCSVLADAAGADLATLRAGTVLTPNTLVFSGTAVEASVIKQQFTISLPKLQFAKATFGNKDNRRTYDMAFEVLDDQAAGSPVKLIVRNANTSYLTT